MKPRKKSRKVILTSPAGIPREYTLPQDALRTRAYVMGNAAAMVVGKFFAAYEPVKPSRWTPEQDAEITERVLAECERRDQAMREACERGGLPNPLRFEEVIRKGKRVAVPRKRTKQQRAFEAYHAKHVKPLAFTTEQVRAEIEAEYV
jgi:hypothetical protein